MQVENKGANILHRLKICEILNRKVGEKESIGGGGLILNQTRTI